MSDGLRTAEPVQPSLRERQRAEREQLILQEAERLLRDEGYEGLVMERLAERVGISKGTVYQHFAKKEDLVGAIILRSLERIDQQTTSHLADSTQPAAARLSALLSFLIEGDTAWMSTMASPQKQELADALRDHPGLRDAFTRFFEGLCTLIAQGQSNGEFDPAIPAPIAARFLAALVRAQGAPVLGAATVSPEDFASLAVRFSLHGLSAHRRTQKQRASEE
jgi:AcrR family transcriptional regulator